MKLVGPALLLASTVSVAAGALAQAPTLVKDSFPGASATPTAGVGFVNFLGISGGRAFVAARERYPSQALALWVTDGTTTGTTRLLNLDLSYGPGTDLGGTFYFGASGPTGTELWKSDGTAPGTSPVAHVSNLTSYYNDNLWHLAAVGGRLFFSADDGAHGRELWTSDGTTAGTQLVKDIVPGPTGSISGSEFAEAGGALFFVTYVSSANPEEGLWKSDGTEAGTILLATFPSVSAGSISSLVNVNGTLFFAAFDAAHGFELWKSDGTPGGTVLVKDILPGASGSGPSSLVTHGGELYFRLESDGSIWKSDGTEAGTVLVHSVQSTSSLARSGDLVFFIAGESQLWASDGTPGGLTLVREFEPTVDLYASGAIPGGLLFWRDATGDGTELWRTDGTPDGTSLVKLVEADIIWSPWESSIWQSVSIPGALLTLFDSGLSNTWRSDGTAAGTIPLLEAIFKPNDGLPLSLTDVNGTLLFSAEDATHGRELWRSDGSPAGTLPVKDLEPGPIGSDPVSLFAGSAHVLFSAFTSSTGRELFRTDGTDAGTVLLKELRPGPEGSNLSPVGQLGEVLLFTAFDESHGSELLRSDGTPDGTFLLGDLTHGSSSSRIDPLDVLNGAFYFREEVFPTGTILWKTDGTVGGTVAVGPLPGRSDPAGPLPGIDHPRTGAALGDVLVFADEDETHGRELWRTDGTAAGTFLLLDIVPEGDSNLADFSSTFVRVGDRVVFWTDDGSHGFEPWITDGTAAGTSLLKDINPGRPGSSEPRGTAVLGSTLYFWANDGVHGLELWKTDGTAGGTALVRDIAPGPASSRYGEMLVTAGREVYFFAADLISGPELWRTDGTVTGTSRVADLNPGVAGSYVPQNLRWNVSVLTRSGGSVFLTANDGANGFELWSVPVPLRFHPVTPCRVADTRDPDGLAAGVPLANAQTLILPVAGRCGIPSTAISVAANVTVVNPTATGSLSVFAGGPIVSGTTEAPVTAGKTRAMNAIPILGTAGSLSVRAGLPEGGTTHAVLDVNGYFE